MVPGNPSAVPPPVLALIHSPLVGPLTWRGCAAALRSKGHTSLVPTLAGATDAAPPWIPRLAGRVAESIRAERASGEAVLVVHSGAGSLVPAIARVLEPAVRAAVFVDAGLPRPGTS